MSTPGLPHESHVAVLVDCDNVPTDIMEHDQADGRLVRHQLVRKKSPRQSGG